MGAGYSPGSAPSPLASHSLLCPCLVCSGVPASCPCLDTPALSALLPLPPGWPPETPACAPPRPPHHAALAPLLRSLRPPGADLAVRVGLSIALSWPSPAPRPPPWGSPLRKLVCMHVVTCTARSVSPQCSACCQVPSNSSTLHCCPTQRGARTWTGPGAVPQC